MFRLKQFVHLQFSQLKHAQQLNGLDKLSHIHYIINTAIVCIIVVYMTSTFRSTAHAFNLQVLVPVRFFFLFAISCCYEIQILTLFYFISNEIDVTN